MQPFGPMLSVQQVYDLAKALDGIPLLSCLEGGPAERAGLSFGDILLEVNGTRVKTVEDYLHARSLNLLGMQVVVFRAGETLVFDLELDRGPLN